MTLPPTFIQRKQDSGFEFCGFRRDEQRDLARSFAGCAASGPVAGEGFCELGGGLPAEAGMGAFGLVVLAPRRERGAGLVQGREQRLVQEFVPQAT